MLTVGPSEEDMKVPERAQAIFKYALGKFPDNMKLSHKGTDKKKPFVLPFPISSFSVQAMLESKPINISQRIRIGSCPWHVHLKISWVPVCACRAPGRHFFTVQTPTSASFLSHTHPTMLSAYNWGGMQTSSSRIRERNLYLWHSFEALFLSYLTWLLGLVPCLPQNIQFTTYLLVSYHVSDNGDQQMNKRVSEFSIGETDVYSVPCDKR